MNRPLLLLSGIGPGYTGVGRVVSHLQADPRVDLRWVRHKGRSMAEAIRRGSPASAAREVVQRARASVRWRRERRLRLWLDHPRLVLIHPQTIGASWVLDLVGRRERTDVFVVDASYFCRSSYNHRAGGACLDCLGTRGGPALAAGCRRFPVDDPAVDRLVTELPALAAAGRVRFFVQNATAAHLLRRHCGAQAEVGIVGLWADEWLEPPPEVGLSPRAWDVVFHGADEPAKGSRWALRLAADCPGRRFLFPFARPRAVAAPANADFVACNWTSGLGREVARAGLVLNPSLWSAPIEGALVKSLRWGRRVAVAPAAGSYGSELPDGLVLRLPEDVAAAAVAVETALDSGGETAPAPREAWWQDLLSGRDTVARMLEPRWLPRDPDPTARGPAC